MAGKVLGRGVYTEPGPTEQPGVGGVSEKGLRMLAVPSWRGGRCGYWRALEQVCLEATTGFRRSPPPLHLRTKGASKPQCLAQPWTGGQDLP